MLRARWRPMRLHFRFEARTSRSTMLFKDTYVVEVTDTDRPGAVGYGECALFDGLSAECGPDYTDMLDRVCLDPSVPTGVSSIDFGMETALACLDGFSHGLLGPSRWSEGLEGIPINGLIWMGDRQTMAERIDRKIALGFRVLKLKIGGIDFDSELGLLEYIRSKFGPERLTLRLDANGSFDASNAAQRLDALGRYHIHSIEQPVKPGQWDLMARLCADSPIPIALDEELIGTRTDGEKLAMLRAIKPHYVILKPSLCGGIAQADRWADLAEQSGVGWWATSALESNIGLHAIARWVARRGFDMPQGLGTGNLYHNNISSPLNLRGDLLFYNPRQQWQNLKDIFAR